MRTKLTFFLTFVCLSISGCTPTRYPVKGTVTINNKPAAMTRVMFIAVEPATPTYSGGSATTDSEGNFTVNNGGEIGPGLMAGEYKVIFQQTLINGKPSLGGGRKKSALLPGETEGVPEAYQVPDSTPIRINVKSNMEPLKFDIKK
jgi:hypothetical protein